MDRETAGVVRAQERGRGLGVGVVVMMAVEGRWGGVSLKGLAGADDGPASDKRWDGWRISERRSGVEVTGLR